MPKALDAALKAAGAAAVVEPPPAFELHIRPLLRSLDREQMDFAFNLWHYPDVDPIGRFTLILNRLKSPAADVVMPPPYSGGPWPAEWIALFERWLAAGAPRLPLAQLDPASLTAARIAGTSLVRLTAMANLPSAGHVAWIERRFAEEVPFSPERADEFVLYERLVTASPAAVTPTPVEDVLELPTGVATVKFFGANGTFPVAVT